MENRNQVDLNFSSSSKIKYNEMMPSWYSSTSIVYRSAFHFTTYNFEEESFAHILRQRSEGDIMNGKFLSNKDQQFQSFYVCQQQDLFFLIRKTSQNCDKVLLGRRIMKEDEKGEGNYLDANKNEKQVQTNQLINNGHLCVGMEIQSVPVIFPTQDGNCCLLVLNLLPEGTAVMMIDFNKSLEEATIKKPSRITELAIQGLWMTVSLSSLHSNLSSIIHFRSAPIKGYLFKQIKITQMYPINNFTLVLLISACGKLLLCKIDYNWLYLTLLHSYDFNSQGIKLESIQATNIEKKDVIVALLIKNDQKQSQFFEILTIEKKQIKHQNRVLVRQLTQNAIAKNIIFENNKRNCNEYRKVDLIEEKCPKDLSDFRLNHLDGFNLKQSKIVAWERDSCIIHSFRIDSNFQLVKQLESKQNTLIVKKLYHQEEDQFESVQKLQIKYAGKSDLNLNGCKVSHLSLSNNCSYLLLMMSQRQNNGQRYGDSFLKILQYDVYCKSSQDISHYLKGVPNIYRNRPVEMIALSKVKDIPLILTANSIHTLQTEILIGALSFDVHPTHLFLAASLGFCVKVYAIESERISSSLFTLNLQGVKQIKYTPNGSSLCLMTTKCIRILDAYSFTIKHSILQKNSAFQNLIISERCELLAMNEIGMISVFDLAEVEHKRWSFRVGVEKIVSMKVNAEREYLGIVLWSGEVLIRFFPEVPVVKHQEIYSYKDQEKASAIEIDDQNQFLIIGCTSGKLRTHFWQGRGQDCWFQQFNQTNVDQTPISLISLSKIFKKLYVGCESGNVSVYQYLIKREKDKKLSISFSATNLIHTPTIIFQGQYLQKAPLANYSLTTLSNYKQEDPEQIQLENKLTETTQRLNQQLEQQKNQLRAKLTQSEQANNLRVEYSDYYYQQKMLMSKLNQDLKKQQQDQKVYFERCKCSFENDLSQIKSAQQKLLEEKSIVLSNNVEIRQALKQQLSSKYISFQKELSCQYDRISQMAKAHQQISSFSYDQIFSLSFLSKEALIEENKKLDEKVEMENKNHSELHKEEAIKETAIRNIEMKRVKEETLELQMNIEVEEMIKKLTHQKTLISQLSTEISSAEKTMHKTQAQTSVIKGNAQFKRIASVDTMNDACSYKLWVKEKFEKEISVLAGYLSELDLSIEENSNRMTLLHTSQQDNQSKITCTKQELIAVKGSLKQANWAKILLKNKMKHVNKKVSSKGQNYNILTSGSLGKGIKNFEDEKKINEKIRIKLDENLSKSSRSSRIKKIDSSNNLHCNEVKFLKTSIKIHHRKINRFQKEHSQMLTEYEKLMYENKLFENEQRLQKDEVKRRMEQLTKRSEVGLDRNRKIEEAMKSPFKRYHEKNGDIIKPSLDRPEERLTDKLKRANKTCRQSPRGSVKLGQWNFQ